MSSQLRPFTLVPDHLSHDTVEALEELLKEARAGKIIGMAFCVMLKDRNYWVNASGEGLRNPGFSLQMTRMLEERLVMLVKSGESLRD